MEDSFRIIYALCIIFIRFPLYYLAPVQDNLHIYNDTNLCNYSIKDFLFKSEYTKECNSLKYEELNKITITLENKKQFLCLGIYDTMYKACQYKEIEQWDQIFPDQISFDSMIGNLMKIYQTDGSNTNSKDFCNDLVGYTPKYDKLKPALSQLTVKFERPELCFSICFDLESKLKTPLCAILVWIHKIDQDIANKLKTVGVDHENEGLKDKQGNHNDQLIVQHETDNLLKPLQNKKEEEKVHNVERPAAFNISTNNVKRNNTININNNNNNSNHNEQLLQSEKYSPNVNNQSKPVVKSVPTVKITPQLISDPMINNISESHNKTTSLSKEADKKLVDDNIISQDVDDDINRSPNIEEDDSKNKKQDKVDPEKNLVTDEHVNQPVVETKSTEAFNNAKTISTTESNIAADNILDGSDRLKNVPTEDIDQLGGIDNPSESMSEPSEQRAHFENDEESHFLFYFAIISIGFIGGYTGYHNKKKLLAIVLKGRRSKNNRGRRRSSSPKYRKLDCTLEEAVTSQCNANVTHVIY